MLVRSECWVKVWDYTDEPVLGAHALMVLVFFYFAVLFQVEHNGRGGYVLVSHT